MSPLEYVDGASPPRYPPNSVMTTGVFGRRIFPALAAALLASGAPTTPSQSVTLPLEFEANAGQFAPDVLYLARTSSHFVYLTRDGMTLGLTDASGALNMRLR